MIHVDPMHGQARGEQTGLLPTEFCYLVPLPGPDPMEAERAQRLYPDREYPRFNDIAYRSARTERRCDLVAEVECHESRGVVTVYAVPNRYTQAKVRRRMLVATVSLGMLSDHRLMKDLMRRMLSEAGRWVYA